MKIFIDTNVFWGDWFARNANLRYLFHFINNDNNELLISRLVIQEVENIRRREIAPAFNKAKKAISELERLHGSTLLVLPNDTSLSQYGFLAVLQDKVENLTIIEYEHIPQSIVVERALVCKRPFLEGEKGYRDTLIWLSLLDHIKKNDVTEEIAFITENSTDFFDPGNPGSFHPDLISDVNTLTNHATVKPFKSLSSFVDSAIDKNEHAIDHSKFEEMFGEYIEQEGISFIASIHSIALKRLQARLLPGTNLFANVSAISAEIVEGIEDFEVISTSELSKTDVYIACEYDLRIVEIVVFIPTRDYEQHLIEIEDSGRFYDTEIMGNTVMLKTCIRPNFIASFTYNRQSDECAGFSISEFSLLR